MVIVTVGDESYYMHDKLKEKWDSIKDGKLAKKDEDRVYVVDGRERCGKSVWTLQQAAYIDPTIIDGDLPRIVYGHDEALHAIRHTKSTKNQTKVIILDEAFRNVSSSSGLSKENKIIKQTLQEMGQNNLVLFLVTPSFFLLELYASVLRSEALFNIKKARTSNKRYFRVFNYSRKGDIYRVGVRKGWKYAVTKFKGNFYNKYPGGKDLEERYRNKKWAVFRMNSVKVEEDKKDAGMNNLIRYVKKKGELTSREFAEEIGPIVGLKRTRLMEICRETPQIINGRTPIIH